MRPLEHLLVLDFSTLLPGPMATLLLAEAGAEVIKIERPGVGEDMRAYEPKWGRDGVNFALLNRGKQSFALDLKSEADRAQLKPLIEKADVIVEQFRPGVMARLGLDYESVAAINPRVIYCSITGYGQMGPKRDVAGHDLNYIGDTGLLALSMGTAACSVVPPALVADIAAGAYPAVINILLAIQERQHSASGRHLDIAMTDNLFPFAYWALGSGYATAHWPGNQDALATGGTPRYRIYWTRDGRGAAVAAVEQKFWENFCDIIGLARELRDDSHDPTATTVEIAQLIASKDSATWTEQFARKDCCCSIVLALRQAIEDPHFKARGLFDHVLANESGDVIPALPIPIAPAFRAPAGTKLRAPALGAHRAETEL